MIKDLDWPLMIDHLVDQGMTRVQIAKELDINPVTIEKVFAERIPPPKGWNEGMRLLDLYLLKTSMTPPKLHP